MSRYLSVRWGSFWKGVGLARALVRATFAGGEAGLGAWNTGGRPGSDARHDAADAVEALRDGDDGGSVAERRGARSKRSSADSIAASASAHWRAQATPPPLATLTSVSCGRADPARTLESLRTASRDASAAHASRT